MFMAPSGCFRPEAPDPFAGGSSAFPAPPRLVVHTADDPQRAEVEAFIHRVYVKRYGASVRAFAPVLVSLRDRTGILAAAGYRPAATEPLFLERYLPAPAETLLAGHPGAPAQRSGLVEVGHLSAARAGEGRRLIFLLGPHLAAQGFQWVVTTVTEELRHLFVRIGLTPIALGVASPDALGVEAAHWGSYYHHHPVVVAGYLPQALRQMARRMDSARTAS